MEHRWPPPLAVAATLFLAGMAGIYFFFRGIAVLRHGDSTGTGIVLLLLGLACYAGCVVVGRRLRMRSRGEAGG